MTPKPSPKLRDEMQYRAVSLEPVKGDDSGRRFAASFSSEAPVMRPFGREVLSHTREAVDMAGAPGGRLPLLAFHDGQSWPIGHVEGFGLRADGRTAGEVVFADTERAREPLELHRQGVPIGLSLGYKLDFDAAVYDQRSDTWTFNHWFPREVSATPIPEDQTIGFNRQRTEDVPMPEPTPNPNPATPDPAAIRTAERDRIAGIDAVMAMMGTRTAPMEELRTRAVNEDWHSAQFAVELRRLAPTNDSGPVTAAGGSVQAGDDALDKFSRSAEALVLTRCGLAGHVMDEAKKTTAAQVVRDSGFGALPLYELGLRSLALRNIPPQGDRMAVAGQILSRSGGGVHGVGDFDSILANAGNKLVSAGFGQAEQSWRLWVPVGNLSNFHQHTLVNMTGVSDLKEIPKAGGPYTRATTADFHELAQLKTYGNIFGMSRVGLINDDLNAFGEITMMQGDAWARLVNRLCYGPLNDNPTLNEDSKAIFHADHGNLVSAGSGAAPSVSALDAASLAFRNQTAPAPDSDTTIKLNLRPSFFIVPPKHEITSEVLTSAAQNPEEGTTTAFTAPNLYSGRRKLTVVADAELTDPDAWFLAVQSSPRVRTIRAFFLDGNEQPYTEQFTDPNWDGLSWKVRGDVVVAAEGYRGLYKNQGD